MVMASEESLLFCFLEVNCVIKVISRDVPRGVNLVHCIHEKENT